MWSIRLFQLLHKFNLAQSEIYIFLFYSAFAVIYRSPWSNNEQTRSSWHRNYVQHWVLFLLYMLKMTNGHDIDLVFHSFGLISTWFSIISNCWWSTWITNHANYAQVKWASRHPSKRISDSSVDPYRRRVTPSVSSVSCFVWSSTVRNSNRRHERLRDYRCYISVSPENPTTC